jgi:hypothetical protein
MTVSCMHLLKTGSLNCQQLTAEQLPPGQAGWSTGRCVEPIDTNRRGCIHVSSGVLNRTQMCDFSENGRFSNIPAAAAAAGNARS